MKSIMELEIPSQMKNFDQQPYSQILTEWLNKNLENHEIMNTEYKVWRKILELVYKGEEK